MVGCNCFFNLTRIIIPSRCCFILFFSDFCSLMHNFVPSCYYSREILLLHGLKIRRYLKGIMLMMIVLFLIWYLCKNSLSYCICTYMISTSHNYNYKYQVIHTYLYFQPVIFMVFVSIDLFSLWRDIMKTWRIHLMCKVHLADNIMTCKNNVNVCRRWSSWEYHMYIVKVHMKYKLQKIRPLDLKLVTFHNPKWVFGW